MARRHALLIGVSGYTDPRLARLRAPAADVKALAEALLDPDIAGFDQALPLLDPTREQAIQAIDELFAGKERDDLVLLHFSGHGIRDDWGRLFFALGQTRYDRPRATGLPASWLKEFMDDCRSRRQVLVLDCCNAGAFMEGQKAALATPALTEDTFEVKGYGREILAATNVTGLAFEGKEIRDDGTVCHLGKFTRFLVEGLRTGAGQAEQEAITVSDLFEHARRRLEAEEPRMRPQHWRERGEAPLIIARNPHARPKLPADLLAALDDAGDWLRRRGAVDWLDELIRGDDPRLRAAAQAELRRREPEEHDRRVHARMMLVLGGVVAAPPVPRPTSEESWPAGHIFRDADALWCPEMVVIPAGEFMMGSPEDEAERRDNEGPQHRVTIARPLAVGRYPITRAEFGAFVGETGHAAEGVHRWIGSDWKLDPAASWRSPGFAQTDRDPVVGVSWHDAKAYVAWLGRKTSKSYRLLSEAEWEYACRAGTTTPFWSGRTISTAQANYDGNFAYGEGKKGEYRQRTVPVDGPGFPANPFGLYHVHGNVWEWVEDCWHDSYVGAPGDGSAWVEESCPGRILRGGSWSDFPRFLRAASRGGNSPVDRINFLGFRVARMLTS